MAITPDNVDGMRYAAQIPKPKPKPKVTPKPKPNVNAMVTGLKGRVDSAIYQGDFGDGGAVGQYVEPVSTDAPLTQEQLNQAIIAGNTAAAAGDAAVEEGNAAAEEANKIKPGSGSTNLIAPDGTVFQDATAYAAYVGYLSDKKSAFDINKRSSQSAFDLMYAEFANYGLASLVEPLRGLVQNGISGDEFTLRLRETESYKKRFSANSERIAKGLTALSESDYLAKEDKYQSIMREYELPESYYAKDSLGTQSGFQKLLANDVSAVELEDRLIQAKDRVINTNPEVAAALKAFYPEISNGDILAYVLDPQNALKSIQRKVTAAEIGGAARSQGLATGVSRAEELAGFGVTKAVATEGYSTIGAGLQRGSELAAIYKESPYTQSTAEAEVFKLSGAQEARKQRQKVTGLETATFGGKSGVTGGALARDRAGGY